MLAEVVRMTYQHRAFYCYVILSIWIFLLLAGMYKYIGVDRRNTINNEESTHDLSMKVLSKNIDSDLMINNKIFRLCNTPKNIVQGSEGDIDEVNSTLAGVIILIRHGDRGPLTHVRNMSTVNCAGNNISNAGNSDTKELNNIYENYINFIKNVTLYSRTAWTQFLGPFHGFPMLPGNFRDCKLGQLTTLGVKQLLKIGSIFKKAYFYKLSLANNTITSKDIIVFSTRYRRTVQSAVALLFAFLENNNFKNLAKITLKESQSYAFCYSDCVCTAADNYLKLHSKISSNHLKSHPAVGYIMKQVSNIVLDIPEQTTNPNTLIDALLTYICHDAPLPCIMNSESHTFCVKAEQVTRMFTYNQWEARQNGRSEYFKRHCLLRAYGLIRNIVNYMLKIMSERKPKIVLYSGHDRTLEYLSTALGIFSKQVIIPNYASRLIIEVYKVHIENQQEQQNHVARDYYFRVLIDGKDFTKKIPFCKRLHNSYSSYNMNNNFKQRGYKENEKVREERKLCPIEAIIRLLHDDYFIPFNSSNFEDACSKI